MASSSDKQQAYDRAERVRQIVADCALLEATGKKVDDQQIMAAYPDLMPELRAALQKMRVEQAQAQVLQQAHATPGTTTAASTESTTMIPDSAGRTLHAPSNAPPAGVDIEGYEIIRELQRGGQGVVYQAVQKTTKRKVAIKVLLEGPHASTSTKKRFEREIELVAQLKHPNIISIFHSGSTQEGRQFYVMDYVRGLPLNQFVRQSKPTLEDALRLFAQVCDAVQFAHQRGIIHRDLKPSNILVDANGNPKLLDFGLAKWVSAPVQSFVSLTEQVVGTLPYISPEQTRGNPDEIDTRTDIYSLGVILYELLTGHYPYPVIGQMAEVLKHIAETAPTPPTRSWSRDSGVVKRAVKSRRSGQCPIDDDLQTIVLRTLSKERERRYQSAGELARDVGRYLAREPIEAKRDSGWYVLKKTLGRHRTKTLVTTVFVVLIAFFGVYLRYAMRQGKAEQLVYEGVRLQELGLMGEAYARLHEAIQLDPNNYKALGNIALALKDEYYNKPFEDRKRSGLEKAARRCDEALEIAPEVAGLWNAKCIILYSLDQLSAAEEACRQALNLQPDYFHADTNLAKVLALQRRFDEAVQIAQQGAQINTGNDSRSKYDDGVWRVLGTLQLHRAQAEAENSLRTALEIDRRDSRTRLMMARLFLTLPESIDPAQALQEAKIADAIRPREDPRFSRILAQAYLRTEQFADTIRHAQVAVDRGDEPAYGHLLAAIAHGHMNEPRAARESLSQALEHWPEAFETTDTIVLAEKGLLWFDTRAELQTLRTEAEQLLNGPDQSSR